MKKHFYESYCEGDLISQGDSIKKCILDAMDFLSLTADNFVDIKYNDDLVMAEMDLSTCIYITRVNRKTGKTATIREKDQQKVRDLKVFLNSQKPRKHKALWPW